MLTKLTADQISKFWDIIKYAIEGSLPPIVGESPDKMNRILSSLLSYKTQCWASYKRDNEAVRFEGLILTRILYDDATDTKNLLIYCLYGYSNVDAKSWIDGLLSISKFAKSKGCTQVIAYSDVPYVVRLVEKLGGEAKYTFLSFDVNQIVQKLNNLMERL